MEFDQKEETPFNIYGYASYQAAYFKDAEIKKLKSDLDEANLRLQRIDVLETQVKELEASLAKKAAEKPVTKKETKTTTKKEVKKVAPAKKAIKKSKAPTTKTKEKKPVKK